MTLAQRRPKELPEAVHQAHLVTITRRFLALRLRPLAGRVQSDPDLQVLVPRPLKHSRSRHRLWVRTQALPACQAGRTPHRHLRFARSCRPLGLQWFQAARSWALRSERQPGHSRPSTVLMQRWAMAPGKRAVTQQPELRALAASSAGLPKPCRFLGTMPSCWLSLVLCILAQTMRRQPVMVQVLRRARQGVPHSVLQLGALLANRLESTASPR